MTMIVVVLFIKLAISNHDFQLLDLFRRLALSKLLEVCRSSETHFFLMAST
jgi:hypothetical protein